MRSVHVSIHDVSPAWTSEVELALEYCDAIGVKPALLVVPNFHGEWPLLEHPEFCARLRDLQASGHEIFLHGFYHAAGMGTRGGSAAPGLSRWFAQRIVSKGEAEFSDVSRDEAVRRLEDGERVLREAGLTIDGFIAPAWSMPAWVHPLLAERGYTFSEDHLKIYDPRGHRARSSVVLNYASRTPMRLLSSVAYCRLAKHARAVMPARVAIHPADMRYALLRHEVRELLSWAEGNVVARASDLF